jgi:hypothetical protein
MFEDWKDAWRDAVANFRRELEGDDEGDGSQTRTMEKQFGAVQDVLERLDIEIRRARRQAGEERENEQVCKRREDMARRIGDEETVRIAIEFGVRHSERATVLEKKVDVFLEERSLLVRDIETMKQTLEERGIHAGPTTGGRGTLNEVDPRRERENRDFSRLERNAKEREAEERLEELKKRMR